MRGFWGFFNFWLRYRFPRFYYIDWGVFVGGGFLYQITDASKFAKKLEPAINQLPTSLILAHRPAIEAVSCPLTAIRNPIDTKIDTVIHEHFGQDGGGGVSLGQQFVHILVLLVGVRFYVR